MICIPCLGWVFPATRVGWCGPALRRRGRRPRQSISARTALPKSSRRYRSARAAVSTSRSGVAVHTIRAWCTLWGIRWPMCG